jgi:hypothetical protein
MERNNKDVNFEDFIKKTADQYRMYPSEDVWNGVHKTLHPRKKWFGFGLSLLLVGSGLSVMLLVNTKKTNLKEITDSGEKVQTEQTLTQFEKEKDIAFSPKINRSQKALTQPLSQTNTDLFINQLTVSPFISEKQPDQAGLRTEINISDIKLSDAATDQDEYYTGLSNNKPAEDVIKDEAISETLLFSPLTIESVLNTYSRNKRKNKLLFQVFFTPTVSYRKLAENKSFLQSTPANLPPSYSPLYDINNVVTHKPDMGLELGFNLKYPVTRTIKAKAGLQFNMTRYEIKAFNNPTEIATISLNNGRRVESLNTVSNYRNFNGGKADWLKNFYFQVSLPVGAEVNLIKDEKIAFGIGSTIQPTYVLGDRAYLISSDYKNYSEVPWLIRRWNVNTSIETFVAYSTGKLNWQVGPQVRYQLLSSFVDKYPIKENLFDFGLKVGIGLNE